MSQRGRDDDTPRRDWMWDMYRRIDEQDAIERMSIPVRCRWCRQVYDVGAVTVTARYADCSVWTSPCCHRVVDDRADTLPVDR